MPSLSPEDNQLLHESDDTIRIGAWNNEAQVGPIVVFVLAFIMLAVYWIIVSPMVDQFIDVFNQQASMGIAISQERADAMNVLRLAFAAFVVFTPIVLILWLILQSLRESAGRVM